MEGYGVFEWFEGVGIGSEGKKLSEKVRSHHALTLIGDRCQGPSRVTRLLKKMVPCAVAVRGPQSRLRAMASLLNI